jgi:hypothetical protein
LCSIQPLLPARLMQQSNSRVDDKVVEVLQEYHRLEVTLK